MAVIPTITKATVADVAGPFFLGFMIEAFGMGVVLILSIDYFLSILSRRKTPSESSRRLGIILVAFTLIINTTQTILDLCRGWNMFALHFMSLSAFMYPTPIFFLSPFLGLFPALLTQLFLLRRISLFIQSLSTLLWPKLGHPLVRWGFVCLVGGMSVLAFVSGTAASVAVWKSGGLINVRYGGKSLFGTTEELWLATSTAVDVVLSAVLCGELLWARRKLALKGSGMREIVTRLILVTLHGGLAVSGLQIATLFLYRYSRANAFCYLPMLFLPKVYNVTLILSLSLPTNSNTVPDPALPFSLPTIISIPAHTSQLPTQEHQPPCTQQHTPVKRQSGGGGSIKASALRVIRKFWRSSQEWMSWSLVGSSSHTGRKDVDPEADKQNRPMVSESPNARQTFLLEGDRRPSEANSTSPLIHTPTFSPTSRYRSPLSPTTPRSNRKSSLSIEFSPPPPLTLNLSAITQTKDPPPQAQSRAYPYPYPQPSHPLAHSPGPSPTLTNFRSTMNDSSIFEGNPDPFASYRSLVSNNHGGAVRPTLEVVQSSRRVVRVEGEDEEVDDEEERGLREVRGKGRMLSFQDMLDGPGPG